MAFQIFRHAFYLVMCCLFNAAVYFSCLGFTQKTFEYEVLSELKRNIIVGQTCF